jgi:hypothetical protein
MRFFYARALDTNLNLSNPSLFSVGFLFVLCVASHRYNLSQGPSFEGCGNIYALFRSKECIELRENS